MAIRPNRYNDPALGAAFDNIASIFAPPSAQDMAGLATARAKKEEADRMAWLFANPNDPLADRKATMAGVYAPTSSYYAVDQNTATTQRGQDVTARTAIQNNAADNQRSFAETMYGQALAPGEVMREVPSAVAGMFGMGQIPSAAGAPKPLSEAEVKGQERLELRQSGMLTNDMLLEGVLGEQTPVKVLGPDGQPLYSTPGQAVRNGAQAYSDPGSKAAMEIFSYETPEGIKGSAVFNPTDGVLTDEATGVRLPPGTRTMKLQGEDAAKMGGATTANMTMANMTLAEADYGLSRVEEFEKLLNANPGILGVTGMVRGFAQDVVAAAAEAGAAYGGDGTLRSVEDVRQLAGAVGASGAYDPALAQAAAYALEMAYLQAKMQDPSGEVNVRELERLLSVYDGGLAGNPKVLANLSLLREQLGARKQFASALGGGQGAAPAPAAPAAPAPATVQPGTVEDGYRFKGGNPVDPNSWEPI
jgi:hypothetical protein